MRKYLIALLCAAFVAAPITTNVYAETAAVVERTQQTISLDQAVQFVIEDMLSVQDLDTAITNMQMQYTDLRDQLRNLERGDSRNDAISALVQGINDLTMSITTAQLNQTAANQSVERNMNGLANLFTTPGAEEQATQALQLVLSGSAAAANAAAPIPTLEAQRNSLVNELSVWQNEDTFRDMVDDMRRSVNELGRHLESLRLNMELTEVSMAHVVRSLAAASAELDMAIDTFESSLALQEANLRRMTLSYEVGFISAHNLRQMEHGLAQGYTQLDDLLRSQEGLIQSLNHMMGQPLSQNTVVEFERTMPTIPADIDAHIAALIPTTPSIRQAQFAIDNARAERRAYTGHDRDIRISAADRRQAMNVADTDRIVELRNRIALQDAVDRAIQGREMAVRNMEADLRTGFSNLSGLIAQTEAQERELELAESNLRVAEANFAAGRVTRFDVDQAQLAADSAQQGLEGVLNQMWILGFQLQNPSLLQSGNN